MSEEANQPAGPQDPAPILALSGASRDKADAFLDLQMEEIRQRNPYEISHFRLRRFSGWAKAVFEFSAGLLALVLAVGAAFLIWNAAQSNDLVMDSFQVPPDLAARGHSGQVVAAKLSDKIAAMQAQTVSQRAPKSYANGLSDGLKLEIPETGVSLAELDRFLRAKLGHDLHIGGELVHAGNIITLTGRVGNDSATVAGAEAEMDAVLQKLAEQVYRITQPYRFAVWLQAHGRVPEGVAILKEIATGNGPAQERAWAYNGWGVSTFQGQSETAGMALQRTAHALDPDNYLVLQNLAFGELRRGHEEESFLTIQKATAALTAHGKDYTLPDRVGPLVHAYAASILAHQGALLEAVQQQRNFLDTRITANAPTYSRLSIFLVGLHERTAAEGALAQESPLPNLANAGTYRLETFTARLLVAVEAQDWTGVLATERDFAALVAQFPGFSEDRLTVLAPGIALALAHTGQFVATEALLKGMPGDCYPCLRARAQVAALQRQDGRADWWFAAAAAAAPHAPFADEEWGRALLARGDTDAAIEKFTVANRKGPHFADPLEGWGEALMAKNQSHLALAKFAEADKYGPNWGRLHLKWGEALVYAGKKDEAKKQFARAGQLDLKPSEKSELAQIHV